jgi:glucans biosynthesis protein
MTAPAENALPPTGPADEAAALCEARLSKGGRCLWPPAAGSRRCRRHGGASALGAPRGNRNALKHGAFTAEAITQRRAISAFIRDCYRTIREIERG